MNAIPPAATDRRPLPSVRFNGLMLLGDVAFYLIGMSFIDTSTALPAIVRSLGGDAAFLGLLLSLRQAASFLAPVLIAHSLQGASRYKPILVQVCLWGRIGLFPTAAAVYFLGDRFPFLALTVLTVALVLAWLGDGAGAVPWTALVGKMIPARQRGRLFAATQVVAGVSRLILSGGVAVLLSGRYVAFPQNMGLLLLLCALSLAVSWGFIASFREPEPTDDTPDSTPSPGFFAYLRSLPGQMREHPTFLLLATVQIFLTATGAGMPFLIGYAESLGTRMPERLPFGLQGLVGIFEGGMPGLFLAVQTAGMLLCAPLWGWVNDRFGPKTAVVGLLGTALSCPLLAALGGISGGNLTLFLLAYLLFGASMDWWIPITNYLIESVPTEKQATFLGLMSVASSPSLLLPLVAGFLMRQTGGLAVFTETFVLILLGLALALRLPGTRRHVSSVG
ncbi:MAG: MFS transporter [Capsulimonadales bacterium]|nr:MFS transporter [Capsulimonadales bacterium]